VEGYGTAIRYGVAKKVTGNITPRNPQEGKTVEGNETAIRYGVAKQVTGNVTPRNPQEGKTVEGNETAIRYGVASPKPTGRKDCGGGRDRHKQRCRLPETHRKERLWRGTRSP